MKRGSFLKTLLAIPFGVKIVEELAKPRTVPLPRAFVKTVPTVTVRGIAGESLKQGDFVYLKKGIFYNARSLSSNEVVMEDVNFRGGDVLVSIRR